MKYCFFLERRLRDFSTLMNTGSVIASPTEVSLRNLFSQDNYPLVIKPETKTKGNAFSTDNDSHNDSLKNFTCLLT